MKAEQLLTVEPALIAERAEALETFGSLEEVERLLESSRVSAPSPNLPHYLREAADWVDVRTPLEPPRSHRPLVGPVLVASKRLFRGLFQPFINELFRTQVKFNERILEGLTLLQEQLERQAAQERRWRADLEKRLEAMERNIQTPE